MRRRDPLFVLRAFFILHFILDTLFAIPLLLFPVLTLSLFGWTTIDPIGARLVAAALFGIGIESLLARNASAGEFKNLLNLKIIWSFSAAAGIALSMIEGAQGRPLAAWCILAAFICFNILWIYFRIKLSISTGKRVDARVEEKYNHPGNTD